MLFKVEILEN